MEPSSYEHEELAILQATSEERIRNPESTDADIRAAVTDLRERVLPMLQTLSESDEPLERATAEEQARRAEADLNRGEERLKRAA
jgi:hypothetical protein